MPIPSLLTINPDNLFEKSSISEIEDVQKKLQSEIERKREELRTMVGERYRDLIEAADTISIMKNLSEKVIEDVNKMKTATAELQQRQVSGFKMDYYHKDLKKSTMAGVAAQIKLLVDIPEYIWETVDSTQFTHAALYYIMARYIKTSLEINPSFQTTMYFPVVSRQWSSIVHFKDTIIKGAEESLKLQHDSQVTCSALLSLALLESLSSGQLLQRYLTLRSEALRQQLSPHHSPLDSAAVQERLCSSYSLLIHSIVAISHCFYEHVQAKEGLLWRELERYVSPQSAPTLQLLDNGDSDIPTSVLPSAIREFRPVLDKPLEPVSEDVLREAVTSWLVWVRQLVKEQGGQLLQRLSSLRSLQGLRDAPQGVCEEWPLVCQSLVSPGSNMDLWSDLYRPLITLRAQQLVSVHWDSALKGLQHQIRQAINAATNETKQTEVDLMWHIWKESDSDLQPIDDLKNIKGLWVKARGISPRVTELCAALERKVCWLLADLNSLCPEQEVDPGLLAISNTLKVHQQTVCSTLVVKLVQFVKDMLAETTSEAVAILLAKLLQCVPELCPSLSKCLSSIDTKSVSWQESLSLLQTECLSAYKTWQSLALPRLLNHTMDTLSSAVPDLHTIPQWEEITIEEEGETGERVQSVLKVPCSVSLGLQSALHQLASLIGHVSIPKQISEQVVESVINNIIDLYNKNSESASLTQTQYLQMLLDIKYLTQLFNPNKEIKTKCQDISGKLESKIDPFDLNVFTPYINNNVKTAVHQTQALLGVLVSGSMSQLSVQNHRTEEPCVLALSTSATHHCTSV
ncbi:conserved oligomeric Golgi complex subunit 1 isoform X2 [Macrosteles quadrilineatus]|uniref:conserved oligomeric Golgi complex subunit 1 isoform X2 n=1 Tax=Macrosteles quadrilineatus TaxID=74068 RepID=UPI0023E171CB|nr:conserved oligomeric Golgi complex subunit 1 isoform X2 [Macrosteles quadrilineatus]